jgi:endonuclease YncB( thermonuclease family)
MRERRTWRVLPTLAFVFAVAFAFASHVEADDRDFSGTVTRVFDGDSFLVRPLDAKDSARDIDVRLNDIDAPEKDQPYAESSRSALIRLIEGRRVFVDVLEIDQYQRKIAKVYREPDRLEIARTLVHDGYVWVNRKYADDRTLIELEEKAKSTRLGLWSLPAEQLMPPWQFRRAQKKAAGVTAKKESKITDERL